MTDTTPSSFEKDMLTLESLVAQLEKGDLTLEEMLNVFEQGIKLSKQCAATLETAEKRVKLLIKKDSTGDDEPLEERDFNPVNEGQSR